MTKKVVQGRIPEEPTGPRAIAETNIRRYEKLLKDKTLDAATRNHYLVCLQEWQKELQEVAERAVVAEQRRSPTSGRRNGLDSAGPAGDEHKVWTGSFDL